ncbi:MAG: T9SS type A sorting domain-containing protein [Bacteroidota bacterium]
MKIFFHTGWLLIAILYSSKLNAQLVYKGWDNTIQAESFDGAFLELIKTNTHQLLAVCQTYSDSGYDKTTAFAQMGAQGRCWAMMVNPGGSVIWDRDFTGYIPRGISSSSSDSYTILSCYVGNGTYGDVTLPPSLGSSGNLGCWMVTFDSTGTILWNNRFSSGRDTINPSANTFAVGQDIQQVNGNYYITGIGISTPLIFGGDLNAQNCSYYKFNNRDMFFYRVNSDDTVKYQWQNLYGGDSIDGGFAILPLQNGFLLGGATSSQAGCNLTVSSHNNYSDYYVVRTDTIGNIIWQKNYGGSKDDWLAGILDAGNNEYILYGETLSPQSFDVSSAGYNDTSLWIVKIDSAGNILWDKRFGSCSGSFIWSLNAGGVPITNTLSLFKLKTISGINTSDGGFLFACNVKDSFACGDVSEDGKGNEDYWILKLDATGNKLWDKRVGGPGKDIAQRVVEIEPGRFIIGGVSIGTDSLMRAAGGDKSEITIGNGDIWLVEIIDSSVVTMAQSNELNLFQFSCYPNPATENVTLKVSSPINTKLHCCITDITGKSIYEMYFTGNTYQVSVKSFPPGIYIIRIQDLDGNVAMKKMVKW